MPLSRPCLWDGEPAPVGWRVDIRRVFRQRRHRGVKILDTVEKLTILLTRRRHPRGAGFSAASLNSDTLCPYTRLNQTNALTTRKMAVSRFSAKPKAPRACEGSDL